MQLKEALTSAIHRLTAAGVPSPRMNAELLLRFTLNCDRAYLYAHPEHELTDKEQAQYQATLAERSRGVPSQYITGHQEFWGLDLIVTPAVLIPRPETEHVVEIVLELELRQGARGAAFDAGRHPTQERLLESLRIADVGTGSGCIALALAKEFPGAEIHATDISSAALEVARSNAVRHQLDSRIHFHHTDLLNGFGENFFDLIVSNPPYVGEAEEDQVQLEVRKFEPRDAVFAGPKGTEAIERLIPQARAALKPGGWLVMEISGTIAEAVQDFLQSWHGIQVTRDLQSIPRVIRAQKQQF